jgi:non-homologous end joining protein Ku
VSEQEVKIAEQNIQSMARSFEPKLYEDAYQKRFTDLWSRRAQARVCRKRHPRAERLP